MVEVKTKPTAESVEKFLNAVESQQKREDAFTILQWMKSASGLEPSMWGPSIIGFGREIVKSERSGREVEWFKAGFSPRKAALTVYISCNIQEHAEALKKLGKHKTGVGCLYINKLADIDQKVLKSMIEKALKKK